MKPAAKLLQNCENLNRQDFKRRRICFRSNPDHHFSHNPSWQQVNASQLSQPAFYKIPRNRRVLEARNNEADPAYQGTD
ncbi:hypothetical protein BH09GEM1_BH09GEM1_42800 [soil metagenome]